MLNIRPVLAFLDDSARRGQQTVLVSITAVTGASTRNPGALMGVAEDGRWIGSFSGGCIEAAVVGEALAVMKEGHPREVRYGAGSPYIDIRLPCGGGIDLLFTPLSDASFAADALARLDARSPVALCLPRGSGAPSLIEPDGSRSVIIQPDQVIIHHLPPLRLLIVGQGAAVAALERQATAFGALVRVLTPDQGLVDDLAARGVPARLLRTQGPSPDFLADAWTACVFYFHDHDWEAPLIAQALDSPAFYVGAMGSLRTHQTRRALLSDMGLSEASMDRIAAPIGLIASSRDPEVLALSTLAQLVERFERR
ncbi:MAG TPA: XdhC family protein [Chakrabartia sp.]|nr:XdhC family protein [Chakrabartia sp.]